MRRSRARAPCAARVRPMPYAPPAQRPCRPRVFAGRSLEEMMALACPRVAGHLQAARRPTCAPLLPRAPQRLARAAAPAAPRPLPPPLPRRPRAAGGAAAAGAPEPEQPAAAAAPAPTPAPAKKASKPRLPGLDSLRFFLIAYIGVGHFISFATRDAFLLKLFTQINVWVGAFFVLSGYVAGYTATELGKFEASPRVKPEGAYTVARVAGFYPLFLLANIVFGWVFIFADLTYNGPIATFFHGLMSLTLTQAWFPAHAEIWNAPTWFLSSLTFAMAVLPYALPPLAALRKKGLKKALIALTAVSLLGKLAYSYDLNAWALLEGVTGPKAHPNQLLWNVTRFHPFYATLEVLMGVAAARLVMTDGVDDDGKPAGAPPPAGSALLPALGLVAITAARAAGWLTLNDPLTRALLFVPLFTVMVMRIHRNTLAGAKGLTAFLGLPLMTYLGTISFPIFILHGPIGQVFYKKLIATKLWGAVVGPQYFPLYLATVLVAAAAAQKFFLENKKVQEISGNITKAITNAI
ncbi:MAG: acyltransferase family-domain-containing protein [Monoraphidium minutum]|nr:MAG: acyltransferase family-domain-containing protein [Monoraphidium minutum]